jgi:L-fuculose-phosphate aldolase
MLRKPVIRESGLRRQVIDTALLMNQRGINRGKSGNVSARWRDGFLVTPSGLAYERTKPADIVFVDAAGTPRGRLAPSSEWRFHHDIYRARPEANAVVHTHSSFATTLACLGREIPAFHYMVAVAGGNSIRCAPYATFGTQQLSDNALAALDGRKACLLANHGMICLGDGLPSRWRRSPSNTGGPCRSARPPSWPTRKWPSCLKSFAVTANPPSRASEVAIFRSSA